MHLTYIAGGFVITVLLTGCGTSALRAPLATEDPSTQPTASTPADTDTSKRQNTHQNDGDNGMRGQRSASGQTAVRQTAPVTGAATPVATPTQTHAPAVPADAVPATETAPTL
jgi:hypothetical protein